MANQQIKYKFIIRNTKHTIYTKYTCTRTIYYTHLNDRQIIDYTKQYKCMCMPNTYIIQRYFIDSLHVFIKFQAAS